MAVAGRDSLAQVDAAPDPSGQVTFLSCDPAEAVRIGLQAAGGKNLEVFSPTIGRQLLELGLIAAAARPVPESPATSSGSTPSLIANADQPYGLGVCQDYAARTI